MKQGQTIGSIAVCIAVLLVMQASVYANHFIAGGGRYTLTSNMSETSVKFQFLGVVSGLPDTAVPVIKTHIQWAIVHQNGSMPFRLFTSGTELDLFSVVADPPTINPSPRHLITITGKMLSKLVLGIEPEDQHLTEIVDFEVNAVDANLPEAGSDSVTLILHYNATQPTASLLLETLGTDLVTCNADICTLTLAGIMIEGEIESHTAGGE